MASYHELRLRRRSLIGWSRVQGVGLAVRAAGVMALVLVAANLQPVRAAGVWVERFHDDFESGLNGVAWFFVEQNPPATDAFVGEAGPDDLGLNLGISIGFSDTSGSGDAELIRQAFEPVTELAIQWRERHDSLDDHLRLVVGGPGAPGGGGFAVATFGNGSSPDFKGKVVLASSAGGGNVDLPVADWTPGRWHTYRVEIHCGTFSFDFFFDGALVAQDVVFRQPMTAVVSYSWETGGAAASPSDTKRWVDNVQEFVPSERLVLVRVTSDPIHLGDECIAGFTPECPDGDCLERDIEVPADLADAAQGYALIVRHRDSDTSAGYQNGMLFNGVSLGVIPDSASPSLWREIIVGVPREAVQSGTNRLSICAGQASEDRDDFMLRDLLLKVCLTVSFTDVPCEHFAWHFIEAMLAARFTAGFPDGTFRPNGTLTRGQIAVFAARAADRALNDLGEFVPPPCGGEHFSDVRCGHWAYRFVEYARTKGIFSVAVRSLFRPDALVSRMEMAEWMARVRDLTDHDFATFTPPACGQETFSDVTCRHERYRFIEYVAVKGIASGFGDGTFHPNELLTRASMSVFLTRAADLPL